MRTIKSSTNLFFDAFKHFKNNISNLVFHELPTLAEIGPLDYFDIVSVNYKSKYPDMKKIGLIDYEKPSDGKFELTELGEKVLEISKNSNIDIRRKFRKRLETIGKSLYEEDFYSSEEYAELAKIILELELNYFDEAVSIRPYFLLVKILIKNKIGRLTDETLLDILSITTQEALNLTYREGAFSQLNNSKLQEEIKRPKSYILDFLKCSKVIDNNLNVTLNVREISQIIIRMNEKYIPTFHDTIEGRCSKSQLEFRQKLLNEYKSKCAVTGQSVSYQSKISNETRYVLDAAHIIPYAEGGSFSVNNGILLCPELHILFDLGLITFKYVDNNLYCLVSQSNKIAGKEYLEKYNKVKVSLPNNKASWPDEDALKYHQSKIYRL